MADKEPVPIGNRINLIDPNEFNYQALTSMFESTSYNLSVPNEDLCIIVELETETKPRTILNTSQNKNTQISTGEKGLSVKFIQGQDFIQGQNFTDEKNYLTTNYTDLNTELDKDIYESLGITDINIDFSPSYTPMVNINFIDIRGGALFQNGAKSKFNVFFKLPYPVFALTVKGYYGKPVKYCLHLLKCNTRFNSQTGNFEINAQFVGYTYAMLNDMIMGYLKSAEWMDIGKKKAADRKVMTILEYMTAVSKIDAKVKEKLLTTDDEDVKSQQVILDMIPILDDMETVISNTITKLTTDNAIPIFEVPDTNLEGLNIKDSIVCLDVEFDSNFNYIQNEAYKKIIEYETDYKQKIKALFDKYNEKAGDNNLVKINEESLIYGILTQWFASDDYNDTKNREYISKKYFDCTTADCIDKKINRLKKANQTPIVAYNSNNSNNASFSDFDFTDVLLLIKAKRQLIADTQKGIQKNIGEKMKNLVQSELGVDTSIRGTFNIFTTAIEVFLEMLHEVSAAASDKNNTERYNELKKFKNSTKDKGLDNPKKAFDDDFVYPWPEYHEDNVEKYLGAVGVLENPLNVNEVKFTEELYKAMIAVKKEEEKLDALTGENKVSWLSFNPLDSVLFNSEEINPYSRIADGANHDVLARFIVLRAVGFLKYANRALTEEEITTVASAEARLILDRYKDNTKNINALNTNYTDVNAYAAVKGKHKDNKEFNVFKSIDDLTYTYYDASQTQALPILTVFNDVEGDIKLNLNAVVAATKSTSLTGFDINGDGINAAPAYVNDVSSYIILDDSKPPGSSLESGINYKSISATPPVSLTSEFNLSKLRTIDRQKFATPEELKEAGFNLSAGQFGVQEYFTIDFTDSSYKTDGADEIRYNVEKTSFYTLFFDNSKVTKDNTGDYLNYFNPSSWVEYKTSPTLSGSGIDEIPANVSPSLCNKRATGYNNYFDFKFNTNGTIPVPTSKSEQRELKERLLYTYAFRDGIGENVKMLSLINNNQTSDVSFPYLNFGLWESNSTSSINLAGISYSETQIPLFGSDFYYAQNNIGKAFLFLHALPWRGLTRQLIAVDDDYESFKTSKPVGQNAGLFTQNEIVAIFGNRTGFIEVPYLWPIFIGALLKRFRLGNVNASNTFEGNNSNGAIEFKIDSSKPVFREDLFNSHNEYGRDILRWESADGYSLMYNFGSKIKARPKYYPKPYQYLRFQSKADRLSNADISSSICFTRSNELTDIGDGALAYSKIDDTLIRLPKVVQDEFIRKFDEFVANEWDGIREKLEIRPAGDEEKPNDGTITKWRGLWAGIRNKVSTTNYTVKTSDLASLIGENGGKLEERFNLLNIVYSNPNDNTALYHQYDNTIFFEYSDTSQAVQTLKELISKKIIIANNSYLLWNQAIIREVQDNTNANSQTTIILDKAKEFTPYISQIINDIKSGTSVTTTQNVVAQEQLDSLKLEIYRHLKKIYDKWIAASNNPDSAIFQCCTAGIGERLSGDTARAKERGDDTVRLIDSFRFIDRAYRDIGNLFQVNPLSASKQLFESTDSSFYDFAGRILNDYNFDFHALPNFINYNDPKEIKSIFTPYSYFEAKTKVAASGPSFVCVYIGQTSSNLDFGSDSDYQNDGFDLNDPTSWPVDFTGDVNDNSPDKAAAFIVRYGHQNQNIFKDVLLDQAEHSATAESLAITDNIANTQSSSSRTYFGQNLYDVYSVRSYKVEIDMLGCAMIQPMMYFQLDNIPMFHGAYLITKVKHSIKPNHMTTTFTGNRIKAVATPILDAATLYQGLISTYGLPPSDGSGNLNEPSNNTTAGQTPPIITTIRENGGENGDIVKGNITRTAIDFPAGVKNFVREESIEILTEAVAPLKAMLTEWVAWMKSQGFKGENGIYVTINSAFRSIQIQRAVKNTRKGSAAEPGRSRHGWGIAIDFQFKDKNGQNIMNYVNDAPNNKIGFSPEKNPAIVWLFDNSYRFGWIIPTTLRDGISTDEFWHWEYHGRAAKCILEQRTNIRGYNVKVDKNYDASVTNPKKPDGTIPEYTDCTNTDAQKTDGGTSDIANSKGNTLLWMYLTWQQGLGGASQHYKVANGIMTKYNLDAENIANNWPGSLVADNGVKKSDVIALHKTDPKKLANAFINVWSKQVNIKSKDALALINSGKKNRTQTPYLKFKDIFKKYEKPNDYLKWENIAIMGYIENGLCSDTAPDATYKGMFQMNEEFYATVLRDANRGPSGYKNYIDFDVDKLTPTLVSTLISNLNEFSKKTGYNPNQT